MKSNLGCGENPIKGYINVDFFSDKADVKHNLNKFPYPFRENYFDKIIMYHTLEHLDNPSKVLHEIHRIIKIGGKLKIKVPHSTSGAAFAPTHKSYWHYFSIYSGGNDSQLIYMYKGWKIIFRKLIFESKKPSSIKGIIFWYLTQWCNLICSIIFNIYPHIYEHTYLRYIFPCREIYAELKKE